MAKLTLKSSLQNPGIALFTEYLVVLLANLIVLTIVNMLFPSQVVLGTFSMNTAWAAFHSMLVLSLIVTFALPFVHLWENERGKISSTKEMMMIYFVVNFVGLWLISRASDQFGMGLSSIFVVLLLALVLNVVQGLAMVQVEKYRTS